MKKNRILLLILITFLFVISLYFINKDLYHFEYSYPFSRFFTPEDSKGNYILTEYIPLKKAVYELSFISSANNAGSGCFIVDSRDNVIYSANITAGQNNYVFTIDIQKTTPIRIGFSYDPESGWVEVEQIKLQSNHVLYKESILRHALFSFTAFLVYAYIVLRLVNTKLPDVVRKKTGIDLPHCEKVFFILLLLTLAASLPLFDLSRFTEGDDFYFHLSRLEGMTLSLKAGYIPPRILLGWMENYGVGSGFYYPDLFLFFPAGLCLIGVPAIMSLRIFLIFCTFFSLLSIYLSAKNIAKGNAHCGFAAAALYAFAAYRLICLYYRNAIGEVQAFIFYPLIVWGLIDILRGNVRKWKIFALGFWGLLMSHMISLAISGVLCAICLLVEIRRVFQDKRIIPALIKATVITLLLGAFFLLPMVEQAMKNELEINAVMSKPIDIIEYNLTKFYSIFLPFDPWEFEDATMIHPYPGYALLMVPIVRLVMLFKKKTDPKIKIADRILIAGLLVLIVSTNLFPWPVFNWFLAKIQFSWRFLGPASVLLCISGGIYFDIIHSWVSGKKLAYSLMLSIAILSGLPILIYTYENKMYSLDRLTLSNKIISGAEYLPPDFNIDYIDYNKDKIQADETRTIITNARRQKLGFIFTFERIDGKDPVFYSLPLFYNFGYTASLAEPNGTERVIPVTKDEIGLVQVSDESLNTGTIRVGYQKTMVQKIGEGISLLTLFSIIFCILIRQKNSQKLNKQP